MPPLMRCGHTANATNNNNPVCVICFGITPDAEIISEETIDLTGRFSKCGSCGKQFPSSEKLAFFEYKPDEITDSHYCGCFGWD
jgi:hypothetical protein